MAFFDKIFPTRKKQQPQEVEERKVNLGGLSFGSGSSYTNEKSMKLSAVYCATNQISNSVALLPMKIYRKRAGKQELVENHSLDRILNLRPEAKYSHFTFFKLLIEAVILKGNGYAYIDRDDNLNVRGLHLLNPDLVVPMLQKDGSIKYIVSGVNQAIDSNDMIHIFMHCDSQYNGISVIKYAYNTLQGATDAENTANNFFSSGANLNGIIKASATLTNDQKKQIRESWSQAFNTTTGKVSVAILPQGLDYQAISVSPEDSQLLESRQFNVIEIARFFNISPIKLFDLSQVSYSSMSSTQLSYLEDTILPYVQALEDEFNLKLFRPSEVGKYFVDFDFTALMGTDKETEAKYYKELLVNGILSIDEVRDRLGYEPVDSEATKSHWIQMSYAPVDRIYEGNTMDAQVQQLDNKVKGIATQEEEEEEEGKDKEKGKK